MPFTAIACRLITVIQYYHASAWQDSIDYIAYMYIDYSLRCMPGFVVFLSCKFGSMSSIITSGIGV